MIFSSCLINSVDQKMSICFTFLESLVFLSKGNGLQEACQ